MNAAWSEDNLINGWVALGWFGSRDLDHFANQVLSAMRKQFGGHAEKPSG